MSQTTTSKGINASAESNVDLLERFITDLAVVLRGDHSSTEDMEPNPDIPQALELEAWPNETLEARWKELMGRARHFDTITLGETNDRI